MNYKKIEKLVKEKYINKRKHPLLDLFIYNYTPRCIFERKWTKETMECRGLILNKQGTIKARPFPKFFSYGEEKSVPNEKFIVQDKKDGSLGLLYWEKDIPAIASRGSFDSEQAKKGTEILRQKYRNVKFNKDFTYLFEIVYPENQIVVNYKGAKDLVLLAVINTATGRQFTPENFIKKQKKETNHFLLSIVKSFKISNTTALTAIKKLKKENIKNREGYVFWFFPSNRRIKVKFEEYLRLHKILCNFNIKKVWEYLKDGENILELVQDVPDEFYETIKKEKKGLEEAFILLMEDTKKIFLKIHKKDETKKEFAFKAIKYKDFSSLLFLMREERIKELTKTIWEKLKPKI